jgi:protein TonB
MVFEKSKKVGMKSKREFSLKVVMLVVLTFVQYSFAYAAKVTTTKSLGPVITLEVNINDNNNVLNAKPTSDIRIKISNIQIQTEQSDNNEVVVVAEIMPVFPGGELAMRKFIAKAIKYPYIAAEKGIQGRVFVKFIVDKDGTVSDAKIARGVDPLLDNEAMRVILSLPKWTPGMTQGKTVNVSLMFPITFQLQ